MAQSAQNSLYATLQRQAHKHEDDGEELELSYTTECPIIELDDETTSLFGMMGQPETHDEAKARLEELLASSNQSIQVDTY